MRSKRSLTQQKGVGLPVLTGDLTMSAAVEPAVKLRSPAQVKSESTPNVANHFGVLAPSKSNLRNQKKAWVTQRSESPRMG